MKPAYQQWMAPVLEFVRSVGITVNEGIVPANTFLPGIEIQKGSIVYDPEIMLSPGDILHEAGHIALTLPTNRHRVDGNIAESIPEDKENELGVICWTYFAASHIGLPLAVLFHPGGYKGDSEWLNETYTKGDLVGLPLLQWMQMVEIDPTDKQPKVVQWLRPEHINGSNF